MTLQERIARAIFESRGTGLSWDSDIDCDKPTKRRYLDQAQAVIDELGLVEENEYHTRRHRYTTPWGAG